ncbi:MAG: hypothetical protein HOH77_21910 [Candidatus Latescibacteria bacterium]|nr:hypothetical protein [Candidatus Latescibacterota bacterium]
MNDWTIGIGGNGGAFFYAQPGELCIELEKCDLNMRSRKTDLRAVLFAPDRQVVQEITIPDDGQSADSGIGPAQTIELSATVTRAGIYGLMIMVSSDRYGEDFRWRFRTNCDKYLIETSRGHKDAVHQEPIVFLEPDKAGMLCFLPRPTAFEMDIANLPPNVSSIKVTSASGEDITTIPVEDGTASHQFETNDRGEVPWQLHVPKAEATIHIDGVTRWATHDRYPDLSLWTPHPTSWFDLHANRWLLTPYNRTIYGQAGEEKSLAYQIHNNGHKNITVDLALEYPADNWPVKLFDKQVQLAPQETADVVLWFAVPDANETVHLRATVGNHTTYSTLIAQAGEAPTTQPLDMPLRLKPFQHENEQFGYFPEYPVENQVYFNANNQPFVRASNGIATYRNNTWATSGTEQSVSSAHAGPWTKIAFDTDGDIYVLAMANGGPSLLYSKDNGQTFTTHALPEGSPTSFDIEQFSGHNIPTEPPAIVQFRRTQSDPNHFWRKFGDMELLLPRKTENGIEWSDPIFITKMSLGVSSHSGIPSSIVSRGSKIHIAWGEATDPEDKSIPGVPAYAATYDRETGTLSEPTLIGYGAPANDVHNTPCITMDSQGYLHVLTGTHGSPFHYSKSLKPNDTTAGWTDPIPVGENLRQTYIGLVCDPDDTLHLVFRLWREDFHPTSYCATLSHMSKRPDELWSEPNVLVVAPFTEYSIYYHRLTIDQKGRLFLSYDYWSTFWYYRTDHKGKRRALLMSPDGGQTWKLADNDDLVNAPE